MLGYIAREYVQGKVGGNRWVPDLDTNWTVAYNRGSTFSAMQLRRFGSFAHDIASLLQSHVHSSPSRHTLSMPCQLSLFELVRTQRGDSDLEEMDEYRPQEIYNFFESRIPCRNRRCFTIPWNQDWFEAGFCG